MLVAWLSKTVANLAASPIHRLRRRVPSHTRVGRGEGQAEGQSRNSSVAVEPPGRVGFRLSLLAALTVALTRAVAPASAQSLDQLRQSGAIGERFDGIAVVRQGGASAQAIVDQINRKRRQIYAKRASQQGVSVDQVGRVYAKSIIGKAPRGTWLLDESGRWRRK